MGVYVSLIAEFISAVSEPKKIKIVLTLHISSTP